MIKTAPPKVLLNEEAKLVREVFRAAGYTEAALQERTGLLVPPPSEIIPPAVLAGFEECEDMFQCLVRVFFLGLELDSVTVRKLLPNDFVRIGLRSGMLEERVQGFRPRVLVIPVGDYLLASDLQLIRHQDEEGFVPTLCDAALHLNAVAIRRPVKKLLDLCGGFALHGVLASESATHVTTSDLNPRAEKFAHFNASLNEISNLTAVTGSLFDAVEGQRFDQILCNPPFIISPEAATTYRFTPVELDGFVRQLFQAAPQYLETGGVFQSICEWGEIQDQPWEERLQNWFSDCGCDVWVLPANRQLPSSYALTTLRQSTTDAAELQQKQAIWEEYFAEQNVAAIHGGFVFMRKRSGDNWFEVTQLTKPIRSQIGEAIQTGFDNRDLILGPSADKEILNSRLRITKGIRIVEESVYNGIRWDCEAMTLHVDQGVPVSIGIDKYVRNLVARFDGQRTVADCLADFSNHVGLPMESGFQQGLQITKAMLRTGVLSISKSTEINQSLLGL
ncbi:methyltransferase [Stieleria sp. JC731]|uniref:methyltransferase n=1 Tax=Pirellulaceae TaxID=2691357 RepID=UPI001E3D3364|nr:methyltransferase [Stieleria sp. JC731]MCC9603619.1 methyltransferase [Stieleria sp. JC731]